MTCLECGGVIAHHSHECKWSRDVGPRYFSVLNTMALYELSGDVEHLRSAFDKMSELIAWASAYSIERADKDRA